MNPKVSVIIPVKNRAELLKQTLNNVLGQTLPPYEVIVVDDASTDHIREVSAIFEDKVLFMENEGKGPGAARNTGLKFATGDFIQFFDSDDLMTRNKLEAQVEALEATGADLAYGPYVQAYFNENGKWQQKDVIMQKKALPNNYSLAEWMLAGWNCITQSCLFRRSLVFGAEGWDEQLITHEDYLYLFRIGLTKPKLVHTPRAGVLYRQHGAQSTENQTQSLSRSADKLAVLKKIAGHLTETKAGFWPKILFHGRCFLTAKHHVDIGGDVIEANEFLTLKNKVFAYFYRWHNKQERLKTGNAWETMHGTSNSALDFETLAEMAAG